MSIGTGFYKEMHYLWLLGIITLLAAKVDAHMGFYHPSVYGFEKDGDFNSDPLSQKRFDDWWFRGQVNDKPADVFELEAGQTSTLEIACEKDATSYGSGVQDTTHVFGNQKVADACPYDIGSYHAGGGGTNGRGHLSMNQLGGCALAIADKSDAKSVKPEDFTIFSVNHTCVVSEQTMFNVPNLPPCSGDNCICMWLWSGTQSNDEMYLNAFNCKVTSGDSTKSISKPEVAKFCRDDKSQCVQGAKQPLFWAQREGNNVHKVDADGDWWDSKPLYLDTWGFSDGAQQDILIDTNATRGNRTTASPDLHTVKTMVEKDQECDNCEARSLRRRSRRSYMRLSQ